MPSYGEKHREQDACGSSSDGSTRRSSRPDLSERERRDLSTAVETLPDHLTSSPVQTIKHASAGGAHGISESKTAEDGGYDFSEEDNVSVPTEQLDDEDETFTALFFLAARNMEANHTRTPTVILREPSETAVAYERLQISHKQPRKQSSSYYTG
jgi:hypothetical protein